MTFKSLADAIRLRNHTIRLFERADAEPDAERKRRMLTFVIVGGGLVGTELAGEWNDFLNNLARSYRASTAGSCGWN
jgi:NADH:ubiquinone reductase (H+-translocating)